MFTILNIKGKKHLAFFDQLNMKLHIHCKENLLIEKDERFIKFLDNIIVIDTLEELMPDYYGIISYDVDYCFQFIGRDYAQGVCNISKIKYYSKTIDDFLIPVQDKITNERDTVDIDINNKRVNISIDRKNYIVDNDEELGNLSYIECAFEPDNDWKFLINIYNSLEKFIKFMMYIDNIDYPIIKLFNEEENVGSLIVNKRFYKKKYKTCRIGVYSEVIKRNLESLYVFFFKENSEIKLSNMLGEWYDERYNIETISKIYSAFEKEANIKYKSRETNDEEEQIKEKVKDFLIDLDEYKNNKNFINGLINDRIKEYGKGYGHTSKLKAAVSEYLNYMPNRARIYELIEDKYNIVKIVSEYRNKIIHEGFDDDIKQEDKIYWEYFEWIVYAMQLIRVGISIEDIESILDSTFGVG